MPEIPARLNLSTLDGSREASFTIAGLPFIQVPAARDRFVLYGHVFEVDHLYHFVEGEPAVIVVTTEHRCNTRAEFYGLLDQFKVGYTLVDFIANSDQPDFYYMAWRVIRQLMDVHSPELPKDQITTKLFAELCRSVMLAATQQLPDSDAFADLPHTIHELIAADRSSVFDPLAILERLGLDVTAAQLDIKLVAQHAIAQLKRYRTIPIERIQILNAAI